MKEIQIREIKPAGKDFEPVERNISIKLINPQINPSSLEKTIPEIINSTGAKIVDSIKTYFPGDGYSYSAILSESHASLHYTPGNTINSGKTYLSFTISTCGKTEPINALENILEYFKPEELTALYFAFKPINSKEPRINGNNEFIEELHKKLESKNYEVAIEYGKFPIEGGFIQIKCYKK